MAQFRVDRPLRIGVEAGALCKQRGPGRYLACMLSALARRSDIELVPFAYDDEWGPWTLPPEVTEATRVWRSRRLPWLNYRVPISSVRHRVDLMWFPDNETSAWGSRPYVLTLHDVAQAHYPERFFASEREHQRYLRGLRRSVRRAARVVTGSEYSKQDIMEQTGCSEELVAVVLDGVDDSFRPADADETARVLEELAVCTPYLLFVGGFDFRKNLARLIEAYSALVSDGFEHSLVFAGTKGDRASLYPDLVAVAERCKVSDRVILLESTVDSDSKLRALYTAADIFVFPSFFEGFGLPPLEAMACGTPVACSNAASLPEVVGDAAAMFNPYDIEDMARTIEAVLTDDTLRQALRKKGFERAAQFSWEDAAEELTRVLASCC